MITEVFGFLIIIGAIIFLVVRHKLGKSDKASVNERAAIEDPQQLRRELKQSTDEIIHRMGRHIDRLELLVQQADNRAEELEEQLRESRRLISELEAGRAASMRARRAVKEPEPENDAQNEFSAILKKATETHMDMPSPEEMMNIGSMASAPTEMIPSQDNMAVDTDNEDYETVADNEEQADAVSISDEEPSSKEASNGSSDAMMRARELLSMGYSTSQISKETQIGRGAIELMRQMYRRTSKN